MLDAVHHRAGAGERRRQRLRLPRRQRDLADRRPEDHAASGHHFRKNPAFRQVSTNSSVENRPICQSCDFYKSIYHHRQRDRVAGTEMLSISSSWTGPRLRGRSPGRKLKPCALPRHQSEPPVRACEGIHLRRSVFAPSPDCEPRHSDRRRSCAARRARPRRYPGQQARG